MIKAVILFILTLAKHISQTDQSRLNDFKIEHFQKSASCDFCNGATEFGLNLLKMDSVQKPLASYLQQLCGYFNNGKSKHRCEAYFSHHFQHNLNKLVPSVMSRSICSTVNSCKFEQKPFQNSTTCDICVTSVTSLQTLLNSTVVEDFVHEAIDSFCSFVGVFESECEMFFYNAVDQIVDVIKNAEPRDLCEYLYLCP